MLPEINKMQLTFVNRFFYPDISATAQILSELVYGLADKGLKIRVITSNSNYLGGKIKDYSNNFHPNVEIVRIPSTSFGRSKLLYRYSDFLSFLTLASFKIIFDDADIIIFFTDPPFINYIGSFISLLKQKKTIIVLQDFFPYTAKNSGLLRNLVLFSLFDHQARFILNSSDAIVVVSENMYNFVEQIGIKKEKIYIIHNWSDGTLIYPIDKKASMFYRDWSLDDKFVVLYSGNLGMGHEFDTILNVAYKFNSEKDNNVLFIFEGDGPRRRYVEKYAMTNKLNNILFKEYVKKSELKESLAIADVHLITQLKEVVGVNMPSKLYGCMASGRPILFIGSKESDVAKIINKAQCGFVYNIGQIDDVYCKIKHLKENKEILSKMGKNARDYFEKNFDVHIAIEKYYNLIKLYEGSSD